MADNVYNLYDVIKLMTAFIIGSYTWVNIV
jgi:hypothetical protein